MRKVDNKSAGAKTRRAFVFVLVKTPSSGMADAWVFGSFRSANRVMYEDWTFEYDRRPDRPGDDEEFDEDLHDPDGFWASQPAPFESDADSAIKFRDGSRIDWRIVKREVEYAEG